MAKPSQKKTPSEARLITIIKVFIGLELVMISLSVTITNLMRVEILPRDWFVFHDYLHRTGPIKIINYLFILGIVFFILIFLKKLKVFTRKAFFFLIFWGLLPVVFDSMGNVFGWYATGLSYSVLWYDNLAHIVGGFSITSLAFIVWSSVSKTLNHQVNVRYLIILSLLTAVAVGTFYGSYEFYSDRFLHTHMTGGAHDVVTDNTYDAIGAIIAAVLLGLSHAGERHYRKGNFYGYLTDIEDCHKD